ncbi:alpha/beta fold hydrolase [Pontibacter sp. G13]|uniref:acetylxylan esterase n=1 Tax=Pontibacter sp. G13 TaxID=3074898 RepID=UPI002889986B|nr:alpha/beta fold hydrolase [Pontibacter sp. G13]WNJ18911.1 alpha/beta fold hydrolase [Pontibacter sp. G13]
MKAYTTFLRLVLLGCLGTAGISQVLSQGTLSADWKFKTGDNLDWLLPRFDDSDWESISGESVWEGQGYPEYDGFAWYRQAVFIPAEWEEQATLEGGLVLDLGAIDDADETYWNGELIGTTGAFPPEYVGAYEQKRSYTIPADLVKFGKRNVIAVRAYDHVGGGGLYGTDKNLRIKGMADALEMTFLESPADHIYLDNAPVELTLNLKNDYRQNLAGNVSWFIKTDFGVRLNQGSQEIRVRKGKTSSMIIPLGRLSPGFYHLEARYQTEFGRKTVRYSLGVQPEFVKSPLDRPDDFEAYWTRAKRELASVAPQFEMIRNEELSTEDRDIFTVEMRSLGNVLIRGFYRRPTAEGPHPAILHVQGYSSSQDAMTGYQENDMAVFVLNIRGHGNSQDHVNPGFPGYLLHHVDDKELYIYRGAYMDCLRALDFLYQQPEVDTTRVAVQGGSQGGALSFATAALAPERIHACMPGVPFLSDWKDYFQTATWPANEFTAYVEEHPEVGWEGVYETLSYIDIKNLAPMVEAPVFMSIGLLDDVCPPHINFAAYNQLNVEKRYTVYPYAGHGLPGEEVNNLIYGWLRDLFRLTRTR